MSQPENEQTETIAERFPDAGSPPSNEVVIDPDAEEAPNIGHPE